MADYPYVSIGAVDVTDPEVRASVELRFGGEFTIQGVSQQDVVDAVKGLFAQEPNITVNAFRYEVTSTSV